MGQPILSAGEQAVAGVKAKIAQTVADIRAIPVRLQQRVDQTKEEIQQAVEKKKQDVLAIPSKLQQRVEKARDDAIQTLEEEKQSLLLKVSASSNLDKRFDINY